METNKLSRDTHATCKQRMCGKKSKVGVVSTAFVYVVFMSCDAVRALKLFFRPGSRTLFILNVGLVC